ncbi:MAG: iron-sulfur cluster-binding domain-containing protein [Aquimonas sp.]|nr:iron-sulfur cluster-binding domain-containing protein [Aquimonas sp.]
MHASLARSDRPTRPRRRWFDPAVFDFWARHFNRTWSAQRILARVIEQRSASARATTLLLRPNRHWPGARAGQHLDVTVEIAGVRHRRSYSLSAPPRADGCIEITVAEVEGGLVSTRLARGLRVGDVIELGAPYGGLLLPQVDTGHADTAIHAASPVGRAGGTGQRGPALAAATLPGSLAPHEATGLNPARANAPVLLLAAGSGITPLRALLLEALARGDTRPITLAYWAQTAAEHCFREELHELAAQHPNLHVELLATRDPLNPVGRIDADRLRSLAPDLAAHAVLACGPEGFIELARALCAQACSFQAEGFSPPTAAAGHAPTVRVQLARSGLELELPTDRPLLQALEDAGQQPAFGCRRGICNTCSCDRLAGASRDLQSGQTTDAPSTPIRLCVHSAAQGLVLDL